MLSTPSNADSSYTPFDTPWKEILEAYFPEFIAFFFPNIHAQIDSVVKLLEYKGQQEQLATSSNPFAHVVLAHLSALATKRQNQSRLRQKLATVKRLYDAGLSEQAIIDLFRFADWVMTLPPGLEEDFQQQLREFEGERAMAYISSIERSGIERGREEGRQEMLMELLSDKFDDLPESVALRVRELDLEQLRELGRALLGFSSIDDLFQWLDR
jgi:Domain of unknown function (DUF4351)